MSITEKKFPLNKKFLQKNNVHFLLYFTPWYEWPLSENKLSQKMYIFVQLSNHLQAKNETTISHEQIHQLRFLPKSHTDQRAISTKLGLKYPCFGRCIVY